MVAVIGAAGYTGGMLLRLLVNHPKVGPSRIAAISRSNAGKPIHSVHRDVVNTGIVFTEHMQAPAEVVFLCTGHGTAVEWLATNNVGTAIVVDLSMDHRVNTAWTYGLPEHNRSALASSKRIANPGCFATSIELALLPLTTNGFRADVIVNATTGSTGAGQTPSETTHYSWRANNLSVYKAFTHQHLAEIKMVLGIEPTIIPMRGAFPRGILATCVLDTTLSQLEVANMYKEYFASHPFVVVTEELPDVKRCVGTNYCFIGLQVANGKLLVVSVLDNLLKGASGQAVQNMNLARGYAESDGLNLMGIAQ